LTFNGLHSVISKKTVMFRLGFKLFQSVYADHPEYSDLKNILLALLMVIINIIYISLSSSIRFFPSKLDKQANFLRYESLPVNLREGSPLKKKKATWNMTMTVVQYRHLENIPCQVEVTNNTLINRKGLDFEDT
jgi:hypothetical protein